MLVKTSHVVASMRVSVCSG